MQIAFIFARGGSKDVLRKNVRVVAGKPLIAHSIETALSCSLVDKVVVSTDSEEITEVSREFGAEILLRPDELALDHSSEVDAWRHAIDFYSEVFSGGDSPFFLSLPATSPLRVVEDIENAIRRFREVSCDILFGISPSQRSPYLNMVKVSEDGLLEVLIKEVDAVRRQDVPEVYDVTTAVYVAGAEYIKGCASLMSGKVGYSLVPPERALDIDTEFDLHVADLLLSNPFDLKL